MKITVLDGYGLNPGDLSWEPIAQLGELTVFPRTSAEEFYAHAEGADILLTNKTLITAEHIDRLPDLKYIGILATGYNVVDIEAARKHGIPVCNIPAYSTRSVAQMVFALPVGHYQPRGTLCRRKPQGTLEPQSGLLLLGHAPHGTVR